MQNQPDVDGVQRAALRAVDAASMRRLFEAFQNPEAAAGLALQVVNREASIRNASYPHMLRDTLNKLFSDQRVVADCESVVGATPEEILQLLDALRGVRNRRWNERFSHLNRVGELARDWHGRAVPGEVANEAIQALHAVWATPSAAAILDVSELAIETGLPAPKIESILDLFTADLGDEDATDLVERFFSGENPFRLRPVLRHPSGRRVVVHDGLLLHAVRERIEEALRAANAAERYLEVRAAQLESAALRHLSDILPAGSVRGSFEYFVPHPDRPAETSPSDFTKLVEGDGLILVDDVALIVEGKSGALSARARAGDTKRLRRELTKLVTDAAAQASRVRDRITTDMGLRLRNGSWLDLSGVREIYSIAVTLEDLSGVVTITDELVRAGLLPSDHLPWTVSIHDLRIISELVERPAELLLYLRRRTMPELTRTFLSVDELDLFLHFFRAGLYVEPDPDVLAQELPQVPPTVAQRRRFKRQPTEFLTSRTGPLDDWYFHQTGVRVTPAEKPRINVEPELLELIDTIRAGGEPGWLSTTTSLISGDTETRQRFVRYGSQLAQMTRRDGQLHTMTVVQGVRAQHLTLLVWASRPNSVLADEFDSRQLRYLAAKKHQVQAVRAVMMIFDEEGAFSHLLYDNRQLGPDSQLDDDVNALGLKQLTEMNQARATRVAQQRTREAKRSAR